MFLIQQPYYWLNALQICLGIHLICAARFHNDYFPAVTFAFLNTGKNGAQPVASQAVLQGLANRFLQELLWVVGLEGSFLLVG